jgi:hypothetical protein
LPSEIEEAVHQVNEAKAQVAQARTDLDRLPKNLTGTASLINKPDSKE